MNATAAETVVCFEPITAPLLCTGGRVCTIS